MAKRVSQSEMERAANAMLTPATPSDGEGFDAGDDSETALLASYRDAIRAGNDAEVNRLAGMLLITRDGVRIHRVLIAEHDEYARLAEHEAEYEADWKHASEALERLLYLRPVTVEQSEQIAAVTEEARELNHLAHARYTAAYGAAIRACYLRGWAPPLFGDHGEPSPGPLSGSRTAAIAEEIAGIKPGEHRRLPFDWRGPSPFQDTRQRPVRKIMAVSARINQ